MKTSELYDLIEVSIGIQGGPQMLRSLLESILLSNYNLTNVEASEEAERLEPRVAKYIDKKVEECVNRNTIHRIETAGSFGDHVRGSCHINSSDSDDIVAAKNRRLSSIPILNDLRSLHFNDFELFGAKLLRLLGAKKASVTPQSNDQGIDFYGSLNVGDVSGISTDLIHFSHQLEIKFAGQAKHYPNNSIGPSVVRELVGALTLARYRIFSTQSDDLFEDLELLPLNPIFLMIISTGPITSGARELSRKLGIMIKSGEQIASFLADSGVGMKNINGSFAYDKSEFYKWIRM